MHTAETRTPGAYQREQTAQEKAPLVPSVIGTALYCILEDFQSVSGSIAALAIVLKLAWHLHQGCVCRCDPLRRGLGPRPHRRLVELRHQS